MNALVFDPSSSATGWALMCLSGRVHPVASGLLKRPSAWETPLRLGCLQIDAAALIAALGGRFDRIVVEIPGTAQAGRKRAEYATSGSYASAVGVVLAESWRTGLPVISVASDHWTKLGGRCGIEKGKRLEHLKYTGAYDGVDDPGGDRGDAIQLGGWFTLRFGTLAASECPLSLPDGPGSLRWCDLVHGERGPTPPRASWKADPLIDLPT